MEIAIFKNLSLIVGSVYIYLKILNLRDISKTKILWLSLFTLALSFIALKTNEISRYLGLAVVLLLLTLLFKYLFRESWRLTSISALLAYGISFAVYIVAAFVISFVISIFHNSSATNLSVILPLALPLHLLLIFLLFKVRRLKSGFPFLRKEGFGYFAVLFSFFILLFVAVSGNRFDIVQLVILSLFGIIACAAGLYFWWRASLIRNYKDSLKEQQIEQANNRADALAQELSALQEQNQFLASVIHKDNRLIPAMSLAVQDFLRLSSKELTEQTAQQAKKIIQEIEAAGNERAGMLSTFRTEVNDLPKTNLFQVDAIFSFLRTKALQNGILFDLLVLCDVAFLTNNTIREADLVTLLADLIDNAIYAVSQSSFKHIQTILCIEEGCYEIQIYDSGAYFKSETLQQLGKAAATSHKNDGGSGIGYLTVYRILNSLKASLQIQEFKNHGSGFTKKITIRFDDKNQYILPSQSLK